MRAPDGSMKKYLVLQLQKHYLYIHQTSYNPGEHFFYEPDP